MKSIRGSLKERIAILRLKNGDSEAFGYLYDIYAKKIYRYIYFRTSEQALAHDLMQDVFLTAWEYIVTNREIGNIQSFIYRVAFNKIADHYRSVSRQAVLIGDLHESDIQSTIDQEELELHFLKKKILKLKSEYQDILVLRHIEGLSIKEIAEIMSKDPNNIRVTLHRALAALKQEYPENTKI